MMQEVIKQALTAYYEHVNARLHEMPVGTTLCVHDDVSQTVGDDFKVTLHVESHILSGDEKCNSKVRKAQYGPKEMSNIIPSKPAEH